ncbi:MAG: 50S ribosomal protein L9, partial [Deltaproteobacteria bacterium]|nr:50S ribosomal protein L9 [Deltaproteobacteria bacterium]
ILQEDVPNLGHIGDLVKVRDGYARNYLLPRGLALEANRRNLKILEHHKRMVAAKKEKEGRQAQSLAERLSALTLVIAARTGEEGRLFGSVTNIDLEHALQEQGVTINRRQILLEEPIKQLGTYSVPIHLGPELRGTVTVQVVRGE